MLIYFSLQTSPGQEVTLTILRSGKYQDVKLQLGTRPSQ
jgi:S1-C subfamily serine protease